MGGSGWPPSAGAGNDGSDHVTALCQRCAAHTPLVVPRVWPYSATRAVHVCRTVLGTIFAPWRKTAAMLGTERCASIESAIAEIARSGYPEATSTGLARVFVGLLISDTVACLDPNG